MGAEKYGIERGDVLMSLQLALTREEEEQIREAPRPELRRVPPPARSRVLEGMRAAIPSISTNGQTPHPPSLATVPPAPSRPIVMVDPDTGAGTLQALRRDLSLPAGREDGGSVALVAVGFEALDQIRLVLGDRSAEDVVKGLVEVAPFALGSRDRVYRSGREQFILVLPGADDAAVEVARTGLEAALRRFLTDRGFPAVRLRARRVYPAALAG